MNKVSRSMELRLVEDGLEHDPERLPSFEEIYRSHAKYVAAIALRLLGRPDDVDDIVHDTFLQARRSLPKLRDPSAIKPWLGTIAVRVARRSLRKGWWRTLVSRDAVPPDDVSASSLDADDYAYVQSAYALIAKLPTEERIAWVLRRVHRAQLGAVAEMCECSLATVKRRIAAADRKLEEAKR